MKTKIIISFVLINLCQRSFQLDGHGIGRLGKVDPNSFSEPEKVTTNHIDIYWNVYFNNNTIFGAVDLFLSVLAPEGINEVVLDVSNLSIIAVFEMTTDNDGNYLEIPLKYEISDPVPGIGSKMVVELPELKREK